MHLTPTTRNSAAQRLERISFDIASGLCPSRGSGGGLHRNPDRMGIGRSCQTMGRHGAWARTAAIARGERARLSAQPDRGGQRRGGFGGRPRDRRGATRPAVGRAAAPPAPGRPSGASTAALPCLETGPVRCLLPVNLGPVPELSGTLQHAPALLCNWTGGITRRCRRRCRWSFHGRVLLPDNRFGKGKRTRP